ncbi:hypothetical protein TNCV_181131 [Trichonephila clavipes]|nr:hypothetical protein TNCV_181131 [Trichonephila clavipes]
MGQERLSSLAVVSFEADIASKISYEPIIKKSRAAIGQGYLDSHAATANPPFSKNKSPDQRRDGSPRVRSSLHQSSIKVCDKVDHHVFKPYHVFLYMKCIVYT